MTVAVDVSTSPDSKTTNHATRFKGMTLKRIVRENHGKPINKISFNKSYPNVVATMGGGQINIYDNDHKMNKYEDDYNKESSHLDLTMHWNGYTRLLCPKTVKEESVKKIVTSMAWLNIDFEDCILAFGGSDLNVHLLSVSSASEIHILEGHKGPIKYIAASPNKEQKIFCTMSAQDSCIKIWHLCEKEKVCLLATFSKVKRPCVATFLGNGESLVIGCEDGHIYTISLQSIKGCTSSLDEQENDIPAKKLKTRHIRPIDSLRQLANGLILSKSLEGKILLWSHDTDEEIKTISTSNADDTFCPFDVSSDSMFFCCGNEDGEVLVYNINGQVVSRLKHPRVRKMQITSCSFTQDCSQILCTTEKSFIFRFDYISPELRAEWDKLDDDDSEDSD